MSESLIQRLERLTRLEDSGCWTYTGSLHANGYGQFWINRQNRVAHRVAYELLVGEVPAGADLDHLCRNRACCNPAHLEPVTRRENARRGIKGVLTTHCPHGHEYVEENIYRNPKTGHRMCRTCNRDRARRRRAVA